MKKLLSIIFIGTIAFGCKNADAKDAIEWPDTLPKYEVIFLMPQDGKANEFEEQIKAHDSKFHNKEGGPTTSLRFITTLKEFWHFGQYEETSPKLVFWRY